MSIRVGLAILVFAIDLWALDLLYKESRPRRERLRWTLAIVALPIVGILLWRRSGRRREVSALRRAEGNSGEQRSGRRRRGGT